MFLFLVLDKDWMKAPWDWSILWIGLFPRVWFWTSQSRYGVSGKNHLQFHFFHDWAIFFLGVECLHAEVHEPIYPLNNVWIIFYVSICFQTHFPPIPWDWGITLLLQLAPRAGTPMTGKISPWVFYGCLSGFFFHHGFLSYLLFGSKLWQYLLLTYIATYFIPTVKIKNNHVVIYTLVTLIVVVLGVNSLYVL